MPTDPSSPSAQPTRKPPRLVFDTIVAFPPNRNTLGGTAYLICHTDGNVLVDCPLWDEFHHTFLQEQGGVRWLVLTHRTAIAQVKEIQAALQCEVLIQEQEAYLLPGMPTTPFAQEFSLNPDTVVLWTPGHTPGSSCVYFSGYGGVLFTGRHLLPDRQGNPVPLRIAKTFHWPRQLRSVQLLCDRFSASTLSHICPAANTGFLRGERTIDRAYERLSYLDLAAYRVVQPGL